MSKHPPSSTEIPFKTPSFCYKVMCSICKRVMGQSQGKWRGCGKNQEIFICDDCRRKDNASSSH